MRRPFRNLAALTLAALAMAACEGRSSAPVWTSFGGDADHGQVVITRARCGACHEIPGVEGAHGMVGPPLDHLGQRAIVAGVLPNTPENLVHWIQAPQSVVPGNAMPDLGLSNKDARDAAAYLYTLR